MVPLPLLLPYSPFPIPHSLPQENTAGATFTRFRPPRLAAYRAWSARATAAAGSFSRGRRVATPTLAVTRIGLPS